jgi:hypothetical protein
VFLSLWLSLSSHCFQKDRLSLILSHSHCNRCVYNMLSYWHLLNVSIKTENNTGCYTSTNQCLSTCYGHACIHFTYGWHIFF